MEGWQLAADIGGRLQELRGLTGWTQEQLASELQRRRTQAVLWENGTAKPPKRLLEAMAERYGWPVNIFSEGGPRPREVLPRKGAVLKTEPAAYRLKGGNAPLTVHEADGEPEGPGWQFGDPTSWDEEQLLTVLDHLDRTFRASLTSLDPAGYRQLKIVALEQMIRAARERGRPLPDFAFRILHEIQSGER